MPGRLDRLCALVASRIQPKPLEFIVDNGGYFKVVGVEYRGGLRYPHLEHSSGVTPLRLTIPPNPEAGRNDLVRRRPPGVAS